MKVLLTIVIPTLFFLSSRLLLAVESPGETSSPRAITSQEYCSFLNASQRQESEILDLYDEKMSEGRTASILRLGSPGSYEYQPAPLASSPIQEASLSFLSKQETELFCDWYSTSEQSQDKKWEIIESPRETHADVALHSNQLHFHLKSNEVLHDPSTIVETMIEPEVVTTMESIIQKLLGFEAVLLIGERAVNGYSRISSLEQTRHEHSESLSFASLKRTREEGEGIESSLAKRLRTGDDQRDTSHLHVDFRESLPENFQKNQMNNNISPTSRSPEGLLGYLPNSSSSAEPQGQKGNLEGTSLKRVHSNTSLSSSDLESFSSQEIKNLQSARNSNIQNSSSLSSQKIEEVTSKNKKQKGNSSQSFQNSENTISELEKFWQNNRDASEGKRLDRAGGASEKSAEELNKTEQEKNVIILKNLEQDFRKKATESKAAGQDKKAEYLNDAGNARRDVTKEAQKPNPNQQSIINRRKEDFENELKSLQATLLNKPEKLEPDPERTKLQERKELVEKFVVLCGTAIEEQNNILEKLSEAKEPMKADDFMKVMESPNKIEILISAADASDLARSTELEKPKKTKIIITFCDDALSSFNKAYEELEKPKNEQSKMIADLYIKSAIYLGKAAEAKAKRKTEESENWHCAGIALTKAAALLSKCAVNKPLPEQIQKAIDYYTKSASYYKEAADLVAQGKVSLGRNWSYAGEAYTQAAALPSKYAVNEPLPEHIQKAIDYYTKSASCYKKSAELEAQGKVWRVREDWYTAGRAYTDAANLLSKCAANNPLPEYNQKKVDIYTKLTTYYEKEAESEAQGKPELVTYWNNAGVAFSKAAYLQSRSFDIKPEDIQKRVDIYTKSATCYEKAAEAEAHENPELATYWNNAGVAFSKVADLLSKCGNNKPLPEDIQMVDIYTKLATCYEKEAETLAQGKPELSCCWRKAREAFSKVADLLSKYGDSKPLPEDIQKKVDIYTKLATCYEKEAEALAQGKSQLSQYWHGAVNALENAVNLLPKTNFYLTVAEPVDDRTQKAIDWYTKLAAIYANTAEALAQKKSQEAEHWVREVEKYLNSPDIFKEKVSIQAENQLTIDQSIKEAVDTENRALSDRFGMDMVQFHEGVGDAFDDDYVGTLFNDAAQAYRSSISEEKSGDASAATSWRDIGNRYRDAAKECKDFLEENNLTPQDSRFDAFLNQSIEGGRTIKARLEEAISLSNQLGKSKT